MTAKTIKLNLGCGKNPLLGYTNIDMDDLETMKERYPSREFREGVEILQYDILDLPYEDNSVDEVRSESMLEHMSFLEEPKLFYEVKRVLRAGGIFNMSVPNFEKLFELFLAAKDEWKEFYRNDEEAIATVHWFGQYEYSLDQRWGYLTASIFGNQNGEGQFHKNAYTPGKIEAIFKHLDFEVVEISHFHWKENLDPMIRAIGKKK